MERRRYGSRENKAIRPTYSESGYFNPNPSRNRSQAPSRSNARNAGADRNIEISRRQNNGSEGEGELDTCDAPAIIGTCPFMCPEAERAQRERLRDLAVFERLDGNSRKSSPSLAVKKFCRTISTKNVQASDVRPLPVLEDTLKYLLELLDSSDHPFEVIHDFVFDRTRSIRQDLSMQNIIDDRAIWMYEKMVQFHVISHHKLQRCVGDTPSISSICHLNMEQLTKCLASLYNLYDANRSATCIYENEAEFRSLYVLRHLDSHHQSMGESLALWFRHLPSPIIKSKELSFARNALRSFRMGNYWRFFHAVAAEATYLQFYVMEHYINEVRAQAVAYINHGGYKLHPYPIAVLSDILKMKEADLEFFCNASGLETSVDELGNKVLPTKQTGLCHPKGGCQNFDFLGLERMNYPVLFKCLTSERIKESTPCSDITDYAVT